jgi:hypothetical protein
MPPGANRNDTNAARKEILASAYAQLRSAAIDTGSVRKNTPHPHVPQFRWDRRQDCGCSQRC